MLSHFLNNEPFKNYNGDIILIFNGEKVSNVECKETLATIYDIDINLSLDEFMEAYVAKTTASEVNPITE